MQAADCLFVAAVFAGFLPDQILVVAGRQAVLDQSAAAAPVDPMVVLLWRESSGVLTLLSTIRTIHEAPSAASDRLAAH